jgi:hypothetical protein
MISQYGIRKTLRDALKSFDIERNIEEVNCVDARECSTRAQMENTKKPPLGGFSEYICLQYFCGNSIPIISE